MSFESGFKLQKGRRISEIGWQRVPDRRYKKAEGLCDLDGGRNPSNLITVDTNQLQTFMRISCFNAQSFGKRKEKRKTTTDIEHFVMDEQLDVLFIMETLLRCQGDEAKCVDMTPPAYSMDIYYI